MSFQFTAISTCEGAAPDWVLHGKGGRRFYGEGASGQMVAEASAECLSVAFCRAGIWKQFVVVWPDYPRLISSIQGRLNRLADRGVSSPFDDLDLPEGELYWLMSVLLTAGPRRELASRVGGHA
jgi:hypothetical protein